MKQDRREFLKKTGCTLTMTALATQMRHFGLMSAIAQETDDKAAEGVPADYRALVCIFLAGGNDSNNSVIPNHNDATISNYSVYAGTRSVQGLAIAQASLLPITVPRMGGLTYGLHPALGPQVGGTNNGIHELWAMGKMAIVSNVGTLIQPTTRTQFLTPGWPKPFQLFSHSDQVSQYQGGRSDSESFTGWGGRLSDLRSGEDNPTGLIPMITSIAGAQLFTAGQTTLPLAIGTGTLASVLNPANPNSNGSAIRTAFNNLRTMDLDHNLVDAASAVTDSAMSANTVFQSNPYDPVGFPATNLGNQLRQVARVIKKRTDLNINRQVFFVQLGGFDTHNNQLVTHNNLLFQLSQAMRAFYNEMVTQGLEDKVTQFTMSDFSRTMNPAGVGASVGSDHAWGSHMFVVGGGITAADFYGMNGANGTPFPHIAFNTGDDADNGSGARGRWIPATSVEQYAATLARWYGLPDASMASVFPKIASFANTNLGFMQAPA
ncbi:MAG TPA: DUF1501 domain-containing protein [Pyrinomonadaceae bacterium]